MFLQYYDTLHCYYRKHSETSFVNEEGFCLFTLSQYKTFKQTNRQCLEKASLNHRFNFKLQQDPKKVILKTFLFLQLCVQPRHWSAMDETLACYQLQFTHRSKAAPYEWSAVRKSNVIPGRSSTNCSHTVAVRTKKGCTSFSTSENNKTKAIHLNRR